MSTNPSFNINIPFTIYSPLFRNQFPEKKCRFPLLFPAAISGIGPAFIFTVPFLSVFRKKSISLTGEMLFL